MPNVSMVDKRKSAIIMVATLIMTLSGFEVGSAADKAVCERPRPKLRYTSADIQVSLTVDLAGCRWWKRSGIELDGILWQVVGGDGVAVWRFCGVAEWVGKGRPPAKQRVTRCTLRLGFEHLPVEAQVYEGSFTYPWRGGAETVEFKYLCISAPGVAECRQS